MTDSCSNEANDLISIGQALQKIKETIRPINENEYVVLKRALGLILSNSIISPINIPSDKNSAMDGYAFSSSDITHKQTFALSLVGYSWAGKPYLGDINQGECIRIFTGAVVPESADSVIMQENIEQDGNKIIFPATAIANQNIRNPGDDIRKNTELLVAPKKLSAVDLGLLASAGIYEVPVKRKLNIAFFSTGDELSAIGNSLKSGQIYDSNRYSLNGLLNDNNHNVTDLGAIADDKQQMEEILVSAANTHDVIITTGGASVGDADYIKETLEKCGQVGFWKIAIKPGKPLAFGKINNCYFFGLPGNPVSVITTFHKIVLPALQHLTGIPVKKTIQLTAISTSTLKKDKGRQEYQRGILTQDESGDFFVESAGRQSSNIMSAMSRANCYIVLPIESEGILSGQKITVEPFEAFIRS